MRRLGALLAILGLSLALCSPVAAQIGPAPPSPPKTADEGLSAVEQVLIFGGAAVVIGAIGWVIMRDARRSAPVARRAPSGERKRERERARRQRRHKDKAARRQRKRNRPR